MPKIKIPRKSTNIDMTAMCDVAFLLLSFFILATKPKPSEVLAVAPPNSVSSQVAPEKAFIVTVTKDGRAFLTLGEDTKKAAVIDNINAVKALGLTPEELKKLKNAEFVGVPFDQMKSYLSATTPIPASKLPGIPIDTAKNELTDWIRSITNVYAGEDMTKLQEIMLVKGDNTVKYPIFREIKEAFKHNDIYKFRIVTNGESIPVGSELYLRDKASQSQSAPTETK